MLRKQDTRAATQIIKDTGLGAIEDVLEYKI